MNTSLGLLRGGAEQLMADGISDVLFTIFEGGPCVQAREGLDGVVEVSVTQIVGYSHVQFLRAHPINNKIYRFSLKMQ